jgi:hypothetical protein
MLNLWLGLGVWDYSGMWGNVLGQVCPLYAVIWTAGMPAAIWAEDTARWLLWCWDKLIAGHQTYPPPDIPPYTLGSIYKEFITFKASEKGVIG